MKDLSEILGLHKLWLVGCAGGEKANLREANLKYINLNGGNLKCANLKDADLRGADLRGVDLRDANLDYPCWPLSCRSLKVGHTDDRPVSQLLYHTLRVAEKSAGPLSKKLLRLKTVVDIANRFHRVDEYGSVYRRTT